MKIGLVDRELGARTFTQFLSDLGHEVLVFQSCEAASQRGHSGPDVIFVDLGTSRRWSEQCLQVLHSRFPEVPKVLLNSFGSLSSAFALANGVCGVLRKPLHLAEVELTLAQVEQLAASPAKRKKSARPAG